jgi:hypothetical protein
MRRILTALAGGAAAVVLTAPAALAGDAISSGSWTGSRLDAGPGTVAVGSYHLSGIFDRGVDRQVEVTVSAAPAGSDACAINALKLPWANTPRTFDVTLAIPCNGTYTLVATAVTTDDNVFRPHDQASLDRTVTVAAPPPVVTGVDATDDGRIITVTWDDMVAGAPDLSGYIIERQIGTGDFEQLDTVAADTQTYEDSDLPTAGGEATYRLFAVRPSPDGERVSASSDEAATKFASTSHSTTNTTTGGDAGGTGGSTNPGPTDGLGGTGPDGQPTSGGGSSSGASHARTSAPRTFSGTFLPPLLRPASQAVRPATTPTTADTGYEDALPYGEREQGEDPAESAGGMASIFTNGTPGRGMAIPVATALVLAVWAMHLRMLARAARPTR